jgi:HEAT repeat protein
MDTIRRSIGARLWIIPLCWAFAAGCASTRQLGTTAASFMGHARKSGDPNIRHQAYAQLANQNCYDSEEQKAEVATFLAGKLDERAEPTVTRAVICRTLGELHRPEARESLRRSCDDPEAVVRAAACRALGKLNNPEDAAVLARIMAADLDPDCRIAAIEGLGWLRATDPRVKITLVDGMENPDPAIRLASYEALQRITGKDLGPDPKAWKATLPKEE